LISKSREVESDFLTDASLSGVLLMPDGEVRNYFYESKDVQTNITKYKVRLEYNYILQY
jgi:hypothetical protein